MTRLPRLMLLAAPLALAACVEGAPPAAMLPDPDACGASGFQGLAGQHRRVLRALTLPDDTRIIEPGMPVTMDYRADRLNIALSPEGRIDRVFCG